MWDELILVWNMKILLSQWKKLYIACSDKKWLKQFHRQFLNLRSEETLEENRREKKLEWGQMIASDEIRWDKVDTLISSHLISLNSSSDSFLLENEQGFYNPKTWEQIITYVYELPKWFRSFFRLVKNIKDLKKMFEVDSILVWGGEILTEETPFSYFYWFLSTWILLPFKKLYLSGGIQIPSKWRNKLVFKILMKKAEKVYVRDKELVGDLEIKGDFGDYKNKKFQSPQSPKNLQISFFPDTSFFVMLWNDDFELDLENYRWIPKFSVEKSNMIVVNINKKAEKFYDEIYEIVDKYYRQGVDIYFARICKSPADDDIVYYHKLKKDFLSLKLLDWEDFDKFIKILIRADKVYTTRLHLFLISYYLWLEVVPFVYQKKVEKMKKVLNM